MKKIAVLVLMIALSSCSNISIVKRHYAKGFYVESGKRTSVTSEKREVAQTETMQPATVSLPVDKKERELESIADIAPVVAQQQERKNDFPSQMKKEMSSAVDVIAPQKKIQKEERKTGAHAEKRDVVGNDPAGMLIMIILCFFPFINLIAMYLHDDHSVTANLWVCLILDILFFLPGIIFALLVVLDVVNLG